MKGKVEVKMELEDRDLTRLLGLGRIVLGAAAVLAPRRFARLWTSEDSLSTTMPMAVRGLGARDVAIGVGILMALENDGAVSRWLEAAALSDAADAFATLVAWRRLPGLRRVGLLALEAGAAWYELQLAAALED